jgi:hypothetical protein
MGRMFRTRDATMMLAAVASSCVAAACAAAPAAEQVAATRALGTPTTPGAATPARTPAGLPTLTQADNQETLLLSVGQTFTVVLTSPPGTLRWDQPAAQGTQVILVSASGGYPGNTPARAVFRAVAPGSVAVSAATDSACMHQKPPCPVPNQQWIVTVVVQPGDTNPPGQLDTPSSPGA